MNSYFRYIQIPKRVYLLIHPFLLCVFWAFDSSASFYFTPELETAYNEIIQLKINPAKQRIQAEHLKDPINNIPLYLTSLAETTELFLTEDISGYQSNRSRESIFIKAISDDDHRKSPYYNFCLAEVYLQWAFVKIKFGDELGAAVNAKRALNLLNENARVYPSFIPTKKSLGLLNVVIGSIPSSYSWIASTLGFSGNVDTGLLMLQDVIDSRTIFYQEAAVMKIISEQYVLNRDEQLEHMKTLYKLYPSNLLYHYLYAAILSKHSRSEEALNVIKNVPTSNDYIVFPLIDYLHGDLLLQNGYYLESREYFNRFLTLFKGKNLIKDTYFKLFLSYWLMNEDVTALKYWSSITKVGQAVYESDKYANKIAVSNELPDKRLARLRLYTDGGIYSKAFKIIDNTYVGDFTNRKDKIEFFYRSARLYDKSDQNSKAIDYYKKVIDISNDNNYYFAPNSALQLGYIYQKQNNMPQATYYFNLAVSYKNHEYENSIEQKAKAALNHLK